MARRGMRKGKTKKKAAQREKRAAAGAVAAPPSPEPIEEEAVPEVPAPEPERNFTLLHGRSQPAPLELGDLALDSEPDELEPEVAEALQSEEEEAAATERLHKRRSRKKHDPVEHLTLRRVAVYVGISVLVALVVLMVLRRVDRERMRDPGASQAVE